MKTAQLCNSCDERHLEGDVVRRQGHTYCPVTKRRIYLEIYEELEKATWWTKDN